jgi:uncharacterized membrane protein (UPF0127 family)
VRATPAKPIVLVLIALSLAACSDPAGPDAGTRERARVVIESEDDTIRVDVEVADDERERLTGLMGRTSLPPDAGMAFVFPESASRSFWMKNTFIPLSIAFWDEAGSIVAILDMEPCTEDDCPSYDPGVDFVGALEVNQGFFEEHGIEIGDRVRLVEAG